MPKFKLDNKVKESLKLYWNANEPPIKASKMSARFLASRQIDSYFDLIKYKGNQSCAFFL